MVINVKWKSRVGIKTVQEMVFVLENQVNLLNFSFNNSILLGKCLCFSGFDGENCNVAKDLCKKNNCSGNGICNPKTGKFFYFSLF